MAGVADNFRASSTLLKIGAILIVFAFILHVVGFSMPHWMGLNPSSQELQGLIGILDNIKAKPYMGLWTVCSCVTWMGSEHCACLEWPIVPGWLAGVRAMMTIGLILLIVSAGAVLIQLFFKKDKRSQIVGIAGSAAAGLSIVVGIVWYVIEIPKNMEFKFCIWICAIAVLATWISTAVLLADRKKNPSTADSAQPTMMYPNSQAQVGQFTQPEEMKSMQYTQAPMQQPPQEHFQQQPPPYNETSGQYGQQGGQQSGQYGQHCGQQSGQYGGQPGQQWSQSGQYMQQPGQQMPISGQYNVQHGEKQPL